MSDEVTAFLRQGGLEAYGRILVEEGFDTLERLDCMDDGDMARCGLKTGHRRHLQQMLAGRFACSLAQPCPVLGWGPYGMAPFSPARGASNRQDSGCHQVRLGCSDLSQASL